MRMYTAADGWLGRLNPDSPTALALEAAWRLHVHGQVVRQYDASWPVLQFLKLFVWSMAQPASVSVQALGLETGLLLSIGRGTLVRYSGAETTAGVRVRSNPAGLNKSDAPGAWVG